VRDPALRAQVIQGGRAIPGSSMTNDPDNRQDFEKPPQITNLRDGTEYIFASIIQEERYLTLMELVGKGMPIMDIVQNILFGGFQRGMWNPDLMMLLAEPAAYMIMALAERAGIDYKIYSGEGREEALENKTIGTSVQEENIKRAKKGVTIPKGALPKEIVEQIEEMPVDSLLAKKESSLLEE
jgi:hypothetical protein